MGYSHIGDLAVSPMLKDGLSSTIFVGIIPLSVRYSPHCTLLPNPNTVSLFTLFSFVACECDENLTKVTGERASGTTLLLVVATETHDPQVIFFNIARHQLMLLYL